MVRIATINSKTDIRSIEGVLAEKMAQKKKAAMRFTSMNLV